MEISIKPNDAPVSAAAITLYGVTVSRPRIETEGMWFLCNWAYGNKKDIYGICLTDGDFEGFPTPSDWDASDALVNIGLSVYEHFNTLFAAEASKKPVTDICWEAWVFARAAVEAHKAQPKGTSPVARQTGGRP